MGWNCTLCRQQTQLKPLAILRNDSTDTHGWVGVDTRANNIVISFRGTSKSTKSTLDTATEEWCRYKDIPPPRRAPSPFLHNLV